jgi:hypothetical protein
VMVVVRPRDGIGEARCDAGSRPNQARPGREDLLSGPPSDARGRHCGLIMSPGPAARLWPDPITAGWQATMAGDMERGGEEEPGEREEICLLWLAWLALPVAGKQASFDSIQKLRAVVRAQWLLGNLQMGSSMPQMAGK